MKMMTTMIIPYIEYSSKDEEQFDNSSFTSITGNEEGYFDIGDLVIEYEHCGDVCGIKKERENIGIPQVPSINFVVVMA
ncbi:hypothetical protein Lal_00030205 [Lupinus albus]|nr:hypothetical protein Lal_00030205 [Lupinus albus]